MNRQQAQQPSRAWVRRAGVQRALLIGMAALLALTALRFFYGGGPGPGAAAARHAADPTVLCADGTRSNILTRTAQEDACAAHGGIRKLLVPSYRPLQGSEPQRSQRSKAKARVVRPSSSARAIAAPAAASR